ncbi:hypothetical protein I4U23_005745 [Adineta vaga]|nr:hypothetical protein I4U23_005745 [Adineta vaga]
MQNYETNPLTMNGSIAKRSTEMLIGSGASLTLINSNLFFQLPYYTRRHAQYPEVNLQLRLADKSCLQVYKIIQVPISIVNRIVRHPVHVVPHLWRPSIIATPTWSLANFTIPKSDIVHTKSGLILHYLSEYRPANKIVTFTVTIPLVEDMCYLIPKAAIKKIPYCFPNSTMAKTMSEADKLKQLVKKYAKKSATIKRPKRLLSELISIGIGSAALVLSTFNTVLVANLKTEVKAMSNSLMSIDRTIQNHQAQILHLSEGQLKLVQELNHTQVALNKTMDLVIEHAVILRTQLVEQTENGFLIGKLTFTSFFAAPSHDQVPYFIYELVPIPFNQGKNRIRLAKMPLYLGIEQKSQKFIRWSTEEAVSCDFVLMTSCRETPAIRKDLQDTCLYEILTDSNLSECRTEPFADPVFVHRVGRHWAISVNSTTQCHSIKTFTALITTMDTSSLTCDIFFLPGVPLRIGSTVNLIQNLSVNPLDKDLINLHELLSNNTYWAKLPYFPPNMQAVIDFISNIPKPVFSNDFQTWSSHPISLITIVVILAFITLIGILIYLYFIRTKKNNKSPNVTYNNTVDEIS